VVEPNGWPQERLTRAASQSQGTRRSDDMSIR
jgi:hypothetical protein